MNTNDAKTDIALYIKADCSVTKRVCVYVGTELQKTSKVQIQICLKVKLMLEISWAFGSSSPIWDVINNI